MKTEYIKINGVDRAIVDDDKRCHSCKFCHSTTGENPRLYCGHKFSDVYLRLFTTCPRYSMAFVDGFSI